MKLPQDQDWKDQLEVYRLCGRKLEISYQAGSQKISLMCGIIRDMYSQDGRELLLLESGLPLYLDQILGVRPAREMDK